MGGGLAPRASRRNRIALSDRVRLLEEILEYSSGDIEQQVRELERRRGESNTQIERIIADGTVETISVGKIRERFEEAYATRGVCKETSGL